MLKFSNINGLFVENVLKWRKRYIGDRNKIEKPNIGKKNWILELKFNKKFEGEELFSSIKNYIQGILWDKNENQLLKKSTGIIGAEIWFYG